MLIQIILSILALCLSFPTAKILARYTKDEKTLYKPYFPALLWIFAILAAVFYSINLLAALSLTFMFLVIFFWNRS